MDKFIEMTAWQVFDGNADVITESITRDDNTKEHYYVYKVKNESDERLVPIPMWVFSKINGKGKNNRFNVVAVFKEFFVLVDLNKEHVVMPDKDGNMCISFKEAKEIVRFDDDKFHVPLEESDIFDNLSEGQIERIMQRLVYEKEEIENKCNKSELPF